MGYPDNIVLIGMFGSGKSALGRMLAQRLRYNLVDVNLLLEASFRRPLQRVLEDLGVKKFMAVEEKTIRDLKTRRCVVTPGGSAVYYPAAMESLEKIGPRVFLRVPLRELKRRMPVWADRGVVCRGGDTLAALYKERSPLLKKYADITVEAHGRSLEKTTDEILRKVVDWRKKQVKKALAKTKKKKK